MRQFLAFQCTNAVKFLLNGENCSSSCQAVVITYKEATTKLKGEVLIYYLSVPAVVEENKMLFSQFLNIIYYFILQKFD